MGHARAGMSDSSGAVRAAGEIQRCPGLFQAAFGGAGSAAARVISALAPRIAARSRAPPTAIHGWCTDFSCHRTAIPAAAAGQPIILPVLATNAHPSPTPSQNPYAISAKRAAADRRLCEST